MKSRTWRFPAATAVRQLVLSVALVAVAALTPTGPVRSAPRSASAAAKPLSFRLPSLLSAPTPPRQVLLVHGIWSDGTHPWTDLQPALTGAGYTVSSIDFGTVLHTNEAAITAQASALAAEIAGLLAADPDGTVDLVCHSMGGLAARQYLHDPNLWPADSHGAPHVGVRKLVMLGTPNWGTDAWVADPVAGVLIPYVLSPAYARDQVKKWSPALQDMYAEWMPPPVHVKGKVYHYADDYVLEPWPTNGSTYLSPVSDQSRNLAQEAVQFGVLNAAGRKAVGQALHLIPAPAARRFKQHLKYYGQEEKALGPVVFPPEAIHGVDGSTVRRVSSFLDALNESDTKLQGVRYYLIAGTNHVLTVPGGQSLSGPYTQLDSDAIVPVKSALGIDPMTGSPLFPGASSAEFPANHVNLPHDSNVINQVLSWLAN